MKWLRGGPSFASRSDDVTGKALLEPTDALRGVLLRLVLAGDSDEDWGPPAWLPTLVEVLLR